MIQSNIRGKKSGVTFDNILRNIVKEDDREEKVNFKQRSEDSVGVRREKRPRKDLSYNRNREDSSSESELEKSFKEECGDAGNVRVKKNKKPLPERSSRKHVKSSDNSSSSDNERDKENFQSRRNKRKEKNWSGSDSDTVGELEKLKKKAEKAKTLKEITENEMSKQVLSVST